MIYKIPVLLCGFWCLFVGCAFELKESPQCIVVFNLDREFIRGDKKYDNINSLAAELKSENIRRIIFKTKIKYTKAQIDKTLNFFKKNEIKLIEFWVPISDSIEGESFYDVIKYSSVP